MRSRLSILRLALLALVIAVVLVVILWANDVRNDRKHIITVKATTPVFAGKGAERGCHSVQLTTLDRGVQLQVHRIRYLKDCATLDVTLPDGRQGYLVLGLGEIAVNPPLQNM